MVEAVESPESFIGNNYTANSKIPVYEEQGDLLRFVFRWETFTVLSVDHTIRIKGEEKSCVIIRDMYEHEGYIEQWCLKSKKHVSIIK